MGKGSKRRPAQVDRDTWTANWERTFTREEVQEVLDAAAAMENPDVWGLPDKPNTSPLRAIAAKMADMLEPER
jgi:hypothetical protein